MEAKTLKNDSSHLTCKLYNTTIKKYSDGTKKVKYYTYNIAKGLQAKKKGGGMVATDKEKEHQIRKNLYNSKQKLIDLAYHNSNITSWEYFFTLEFNANEIDYKNYKEVSSLLSKFLDNLKHQNKDMKYIIVPELHPTSGGVHFHGIFSNVPNLKLEEAISPKTGKKIYKNGSQIFNIKNYKLGFNTCSKIKNQTACSVYISKYITKNLIDLNYKKRFWASRNLERPIVEYALFNPDTDSFCIDKDFIDNCYIGDTSICFETSQVNIISTKQTH